MQNSETKQPPVASGPQSRRFGLIAAILVALTLGFSIGTLWTNYGYGVADQFHRLYYDDYTNTWNSTRWLGVPIEKLPFDTWMLQEILYENRPDVLLEMGTYKGASALYCASIFDLIGNGRVITVDIERQPNLPSHPRIVYLNGSSTSQEIARQIRALIKPGEKVMVALDSDHHVAHVRDELRIYSQFVTPGQYLIVEDTNVNGHPAAPNWGDPGPFAALAPFLKEHPEFTPDLHRERLKMTFNPGGWLKRVQ